ncbi:carbon-monoxide dehydrogenase large subunit [Stella humosa]|uniref:Carbon-monoxide dehydrogenase large subunit n=1 Tax=Stella humosa TaxID=94 RepID=A0A3N1M3S9_9PROT|nr:xanthine dehydrogenase family protein molybdopterin-binding subunit [Stella humosa]ROQ00392.1 carbon-monoxide dehydrogenase large subunit [Stella humosa]BBK30365.1 carbon monoxide dehydrogenase [Stella humosa]
MDPSLQKFGIGQPVPRSEDPVLVKGHGRYTDDINLAGQAHAWIVRSPVAHGVLNGIDVEAAREAPGVLGVWTGADLEAAGYGPLKCAAPMKNSDGSAMRKPERPALARDRVRWVGDPVAVVVARTVAEAREAADLVALDIDPLPAVTDAGAAAADGAPQLYDDVPGNLVLDFHYGDAGKTAAAFAEAAHVVAMRLVSNRIIVSAMEPRSAIGEFTGGRWVLHVGSQGVFGLRAGMAEIMGVPAKELRVLTSNVGGSFGMKAPPYPEYVAVLHAARELGVPVKWTDERSGSFLSDTHGRDHVAEAELALAADGRFLAVRIRNFADMGAYLTTPGPLMATTNIIKNVPSVYATPLLEVTTRCMVTNTTPIGAYRGAGRPEGNFIMERLIERAAAEMGIDRVELRRRNMIRPDQIPFTAASEMVYDSGDFAAVMETALETADWDGYAARQTESQARGRLRGRGIGCYLEVTAPANKEMGGLRFEEDGTVTIITGTLDYGQGHATPFAQILADRLGIPFEQIRLLQGDSDEMQAGGGTGGSRSVTNSGQAIHEASIQVVDKGRALAAHLLEAAEADIEFAAGRFVIAGTDRAIGIMEMAARLRSRPALPAGVPDSLDVSHVSDGAPSAFPNGCHVVEVEIDPETGTVEILRYNSVNDFGTIVNPLLVEGQVHGGVVQGIGQALMERVVYDESGQLLTGSYMDYAIPRAPDLPTIGFRSHPVPARSNPLGTKGCGEAGCAGALGSVMNAVADALAQAGVDHIDMPATPSRIWAALQAAKAA